MTEPQSNLRRAKNEVFFRQHNERVQAALENLRDGARQDGEHRHYTDHDDLLIHFFCECSDENCHQRIRLSSSEYRSIHAKRNRFVLVPGHEVLDIERVVTKNSNYEVVEKRRQPPAKATKLRSTKEDNR
jgi:hypothetical protein